MIKRSTVWRLLLLFCLTFWSAVAYGAWHIFHA